MNGMNGYDDDDNNMYKRKMFIHKLERTNKRSRAILWVAFSVCTLHIAQVKLKRRNSHHYGYQCDAISIHDAHVCGI